MNIRTMLFLALLKIKSAIAFVITFLLTLWLFPEIHSNAEPSYLIYLTIIFSLNSLVFEKLNNKLNFSTYIITAVREYLILIALSYIIEVFFNFTHSSFPILIFSFLLITDSLIYILLRQVILSINSKNIQVNKLVIIGNGFYKKELKKFIEKNPFTGYHIVEEILIDYEAPQKSLSNLTKVLEKNEVHELLIIENFSQGSVAEDLVEVADRFGLRLRIIPDFSSLIDSPELGLTKLGSVPIINLRVIPLDRLKNKILKRSLDLLLSTVFIIILMPLLILISVCIIMDSKGPILFVPNRVGKNGKIFRCLKFRTMHPNKSDSSTSKNDPRITRIGKLLRRTSLDELPQLFNILVGQMSIAGPRPHRVSLNKEFQKSVNGYMIRHYVKPGLTGWAQIHNLRGPTTTLDQKLERKEYDIWYILNWSFFLDLRIISLTILRFPFQSNAF